MSFYHHLVTLCTILFALSGCNSMNAKDGTKQSRTLKIQQIRSATIKITYGQTVFLIDPMLANKGAYPAFTGTYDDESRNPLVDLPLPLDEIVNVDAVIVTHTHLDHWDEAAKRLLRKSMPIFAQNSSDAAKIRSAGFTDVRVLHAGAVFNGVHLIKTEGQHGTKELLSKFAGRLGEASGIIFKSHGQKTVYVAGDTIWTSDTDKNILSHRPDVIILNTGYARYRGFDGSIIMGKDDLWRAYAAAPNATIVASHMEALNHLTQTRTELRDFIKLKGMDKRRVLIPSDGDEFIFRN